MPQDPQVDTLAAFFADSPEMLLCIPVHRPPAPGRSRRRGLRIPPREGGEATHGFDEVHGRWWENWFLPLRDDQGEILGVAGVTLDITDAKDSMGRQRVASPG